MLWEFSGTHFLCVFGFIFHILIISSPVVCSFEIRFWSFSCWCFCLGFGLIWGFFSYISKSSENIVKKWLLQHLFNKLNWLKSLGLFSFHFLPLTIFVFCFFFLPHSLDSNFTWKIWRPEHYEIQTWSHPLECSQ